MPFLDRATSFLAKHNSPTSLLHDLRQCDVVLQRGRVGFQSRSEIVQDSLNAIGQQCTGDRSPKWTDIEKTICRNLTAWRARLSGGIAEARAGLRELRPHRSWSNRVSCGDITP